MPLRQTIHVVSTSDRLTFGGQKDKAYELDGYYFPKESRGGGNLILMAGFYFLKKSNADLFAEWINEQEKLV